MASDYSTRKKRRKIEVDFMYHHFTRLRRINNKFNDNLIDMVSLLLTGVIYKNCYCGK